MEGHMSKRRRIYSVVPNSMILGWTFAQKYAQHLVPALRKINKKKKSSSVDKDVYELRKNVKYDMDMALALSTGGLGFAWSRALGNNLRRDYDDTSTVGSFELDENRSAVTNRARFPTHVSIKSKCGLENVEFKGSTKRSKILEESVEESSEEEHEQIGEGQLSSLRKLLPGGKEIVDEEEVLVEVASYIICLQQQVHILQCLVQTHDS